VFLKHKEMFECLKDCSCVLKIFGERCLISDDLVRKITDIGDNKNQRNR